MQSIQIILVFALKFRKCINKCCLFSYSVPSLCVFLFLSACNSDGDGAPVAPLVTNPPADDPGNTPLENVNGALDGLIWLTENGRFLNLDTGVEVRLSEHPVYPSRSGDTYIELIEEYRPAGYFDCGLPYISRMNIRDANTGLLTSSIEKTISFYGPAKLSPDGEAIALFASDDQGCNSDNTRLFIYSRSGELLTSAVSSVGSFDWLPDNRLAFFLFGEDGVELAVETTKNTLSYRTVINLTGLLQGTPMNLEISRDGTTAIFEVVTGTPELFSTLSFRDATVWRVNLDGSGLEKIVDSSRTTISAPRVNQPVWSPDNNWMLVTENHFSGGIISPIAPGIYNVHTVLSDELTYLVPADIGPVSLPPPSYSPTGIRPLFALDGGSAVPISVNPIGDLQWTPANVRPVEKIGELPPAGAGINRGLGGTIFGFDEADLSVLKYSVDTDRLNSLSLTATTDSGSLTKFGVSPTGVRIVARNRITAQTVSLIVFDDTGRQINAIDLPESSPLRFMYSNFYFSPMAENLVAWRYSDVGALGDLGIVVVNTDTGEYVVTQTDSFYQSASFTANGDLLLTSGGVIYSMDYSNGSFGERRVLGQVGERIFDLYANPVKPEILYRAGEFYYIAEIDGDNPRRLFSPLGDKPNNVRWTPDGEHIAFEWSPVATQRDDPQPIFVTSAATTNLQLDSRSIGNKAFEVDLSGKLNSRSGEEGIPWFWY